MISKILADLLDLGYLMSYYNNMGFLDANKKRIQAEEKKRSAAAKKLALELAQVQRELYPYLPKYSSLTMEALYENYYSGIFTYRGSSLCLDPSFFNQLTPETAKAAFEKLVDVIERNCSLL